MPSIHPIGVCGSEPWRSLGTERSSPSEHPPTPTPLLQNTHVELSTSSSITTTNGMSNRHVLARTCTRQGSASLSLTVKCCCIGDLQALFGALSLDKFGRTVALSKDGTYLTVGQRNEDQTRVRESRPESPECPMICRCSCGRTPPILS